MAATTPEEQLEAERTAAKIRVFDDPTFYYGDHYWKPGNPGNPGKKPTPTGEPLTVKRQA